MRFRRHSSGKASYVSIIHMCLNLERGATIVEGEEEEEEEEAIDGRFPEVLLFIIILSNDCFKFKQQLRSLNTIFLRRKDEEMKEVNPSFPATIPLN